jgi:hypothetical protein
MRTGANPFTDPAEIRGPLYATAGRLASRTSALHRAHVSGRHAADVIADLAADAVILIGPCEITQALGPAVARISARGVKEYVVKKHADRDKHTESTYSGRAVFPAAGCSPGRRCRWSSRGAERVGQVTRSPQRAARLAAPRGRAGGTPARRW